MFKKWLNIFANMRNKKSNHNFIVPRLPFYSKYINVIELVLQI